MGWLFGKKTIKERFDKVKRDNKRITYEESKENQYMLGAIKQLREIEKLLSDTTPYSRKKKQQIQSKLILFEKHILLVKREIDETKEIATDALINFQKIQSTEKDAFEEESKHLFIEEKKEITTLLQSIQQEKQIIEHISSFHIKVNKIKANTDELLQELEQIELSCDAFEKDIKQIYLLQNHSIKLLTVIENIDRPLFLQR